MSPILSASSYSLRDGDRLESNSSHSNLVFAEVPIHLGTAIDWKGPVITDQLDKLFQVPIHLGTAIDWKGTNTLTFSGKSSSYSLRDGDRLEIIQQVIMK